LIECTRDDSEEEFNYQIIHFLLVLNEQYMMAHMENKVLDALSRKFGQCDTLSQNLVFMLNRSGKKKKRKTENWEIGWLLIHLNRG
jgi:hypothetical protein